MRVIRPWFRSVFLELEWRETFSICNFLHILLFSLRWRHIIFRPSIVLRFFVLRFDTLFIRFAPIGVRGEIGRKE